MKMKDNYLFNFLEESLKKDDYTLRIRITALVSYKNLVEALYIITKEIEDMKNDNKNNI